MKEILLLLTLLASNLSSAQVGSGTIIILDLAKDKMVIAGDSRISYDDRPSDDSHCKIEVFSHRIVFASMGAVIRFRRDPFDPSPGWDNSDLARRSVRAEASLDKDPDVEIRDVATIWANTLASYWRSVYQSDRATIDKATKAGAGMITGGIFAEARNGSVHWRFVAVVVYPDVDTPVQAITGNLKDCWPCGQDERVCAMARPLIPAEFCAQNTQRAKDEAARWTVSPELAGKFSRETLHAMRLVDLTIAFDPIKGLGGKIDALELYNDGTINWSYRKQNCPASEE